MIEYIARGNEATAQDAQEGTRFFRGLIAAMFWGVCVWTVICTVVLGLIWTF